MGMIEFFLGLALGCGATAYFMLKTKTKRPELNVEEAIEFLRSKKYFVNVNATPDRKDSYNGQK